MRPEWEVGTAVSTAVATGGRHLVPTAVAGARVDNVSRAAAALVALGSPESVEGHGLGVVRLAQLTGGDKGQVSRLLTTLAEQGLVERDADTRSYRLGWQLFALAARAGSPSSVGRSRTRPTSCPRSCESTAGHDSAQRSPPSSTSRRISRCTIPRRASLTRGTSRRRRRTVLRSMSTTRT